MRHGLYGKLPTKRDFIAEALPAGFLRLWEPWLQGGVATSRMDLGTRWLPIYLTAPIWRFWIGHHHCGQTLAGAFMPSVDGVGRHFPLTLVTAADEGSVIPAPDVDPAETWFAAVEDLLLSALDDGRSFDELSADLAALPEPATLPLAEMPEGAGLLADGGSIAVGREPSAASCLEVSYRARGAADQAIDVFFWTIGGGDFPAIAIRGRSLPDPAVFRGFLTGRFDRQPHRAARLEQPTEGEAWREPVSNGGESER